MTLRDFFIGRAAVFAFVLVAALGAFLVRTYLWPAPALETPMIGEEAAQESGLLGFAWRFEGSDSLNPDGNAATDVFLDVSYENEGTVTRLIDTTNGSCNELPDAEEDRASGTMVIQCYGAGLGYRYKITKTESAYLIERKEFEEASPDYEPVPKEYQAIATIPLQY